MEVPTGQRAVVSACGQSADRGPDHRLTPLVGLLLPVVTSSRVQSPNREVQAGVILHAQEPSHRDALTGVIRKLTAICEVSPLLQIHLVPAQHMPKAKTHPRHQAPPTRSVEELQESPDHVMVLGASSCHRLPRAHHQHQKGGGVLMALT